MIIDSGTRQAAVDHDEPTAEFAAERLDITTISTVAAKETRDIRAVVEIRRRFGGQMPRALLGGNYVSDMSTELVIEIHAGSPGSDGRRTCRSQLSEPMIPGLPGEYVNSVLSVLMGARLPGGRIVIDRSGFDPVESSYLSFSNAAEILSASLSAQVSGENIPAAVERVMQRWT